MSEAHDSFDALPEYKGGDVVPADLWGAAPERGAACDVVEKALGEQWESVPAYVIVDALIEVGLLANETGPGNTRFLMENRPRADLIRRVKAYQAEQRAIEQILAEALDYSTGDGHYAPQDEFDVAGDTAETLAMKVRTFIQTLPRTTDRRGRGNEHPPGGRDRVHS